MTKAGTAMANAAHLRETIPTVTKPPNYLDFLVALDEHISNDPLGYVQDWSGLHRIAQEGGLETPTLPQAARWTGQLYHHKYVTLKTLGLGTHNDPPAGDFTDQDLQRLREFEITPLGRE